MICLLGRDPEKDNICTGSACYRCGWEKAEHERRQMLLRVNGLTQKHDGTRGLIIGKPDTEGGDDDDGE